MRGVCKEEDVVQVKDDPHSLRLAPLHYWACNSGECVRSCGQAEWCQLELVGLTIPDEFEESPVPMMYGNVIESVFQI